MSQKIFGYNFKVDSVLTDFVESSRGYITKIYQNIPEVIVTKCIEYPDIVSPLDITGNAFVVWLSLTRYDSGSEEQDYDYEPLAIFKEKKFANEFKKYFWAGARHIKTSDGQTTTIDMNALGYNRSISAINITKVEVVGP